MHRRIENVKEIADEVQYLQDPSIIYIGSLEELQDEINLPQKGWEMADAIHSKLGNVKKD